LFGVYSDLEQIELKDVSGNLVRLPKSIFQPAPLCNSFVNLRDADGQLISVSKSAFLSTGQEYIKVHDVEGKLITIPRAALADPGLYVQMEDADGHLISVPKSLFKPSNAELDEYISIKDINGKEVSLPKRLFVDQGSSVTLTDVAGNLVGVPKAFFRAQEAIMNADSVTLRAPEGKLVSVPKSIFYDPLTMNIFEAGRVTSSSVTLEDSEGRLVSVPKSVFKSPNLHLLDAEGQSLSIPKKKVEDLETHYRLQTTDGQLVSVPKVLFNDEQAEIVTIRDVTGVNFSAPRGVLEGKSGERPKMSSGESSGSTQSANLVGKEHSTSVTDGRGRAPNWLGKGGETSVSATTATAATAPMPTVPAITAATTAASTPAPTALTRPSRVPGWASKDPSTPSSTPPSVMPKSTSQAKPETPQKPAKPSKPTKPVKKAPPPKPSSSQKTSDSPKTEAETVPALPNEEEELLKLMDSNGDSLEISRKIISECELHVPVKSSDGGIYLVSKKLLNRKKNDSSEDVGLVDISGKDLKIPSGMQNLFLCSFYLSAPVNILLIFVLN
jgi:hypothetical protein